MEGGEAFYISNAAQITASDNNNLFVKGGMFVYWGGSISNLAGLTSTSGMDTKTTTVDPMFISAKLHIKNYLRTFVAINC